MTGHHARNVPGRHSRRLVCAGALAALVFSTMGCGRLEEFADPPASGPAGGDSSPSLGVDEAAVALLPDSVASRHTLRVAIPTNEPPTQFYSEGTRYMTGTNPDVARLIGKALNLDVDIKVVNFDSIIPGIAAGRYDMTVSSMTPTTKRMAVMDFVDYMQVGNAIVVAKGGEPITKDTLCGRRVGVLTGSYQLTVNIPAYNQDCAAAGKPPIQIGQFQDTRQAVSALTSGRQDTVLADSPILEYATAHNPAVEVSDTFEYTPVAVGVSKEPALVDAVSAALDVVVSSDAYGEVLRKYGLESAMITDARVNAAQ
ncbi:ABC transporter substrate-binding protein [Rhodococcus sp. WS4]|nr:ABC transporter substrate-binding protein [Rhodococcus sp. WS4]